MKKLASNFFASVVFITAISAQAQEVYPSQNIRFVVPFAAGSATDTLARLLANRMSTTLGRSVFAENIARGNGIPASQNVVPPAPDGYTAVVTSKKNKA